jgi:hypothetical protein
MESKTEKNNVMTTSDVVNKTHADSDQEVLNAVHQPENLVSLNVDATALVFADLLILNKLVLNAKFPVLVKENVNSMVLAFSKFFF